MVRSALRTAKQATIAGMLKRDAGDVSRWVGGDIAVKIAIEDIGLFLAGCGLKAVSNDASINVALDEYRALLLFAERGMTATKIAAE